MFWSVLLGPEHCTSFRFRLRGVTYAIPSLPFGWTGSSSMAVEVLAAYLTLRFPGDVTVIQYVDDVLLIYVDGERLRLATRLLRDELRAAGGVMSAKSQVERTANITWMGRHLDGSRYSLIQSAKYMATATTMWVKLATKGYDRRTMRRLCGKLVWASWPGHGALPFLSGAHVWLN